VGATGATYGDESDRLEQDCVKGAISDKFLLVSQVAEVLCIVRGVEKSDGSFMAGCRVNGRVAFGFRHILVEWSLWNSLNKGRMFSNVQLTINSTG
jgi:hypothetical protein